MPKSLQQCEQNKHQQNQHEEAEAATSGIPAVFIGLGKPLFQRFFSPVFFPCSLDRTWPFNWCTTAWTCGSLVADFPAAFFAIDQSHSRNSHLLVCQISNAPYFSLSLFSTSGGQNA